MKIALCLLTRNEIDCVQLLFPKLLALNLPDYDELYVVDGGSTDGTVEYFQQQNIPVISQSKRGRGEAFQLAFKNIQADAYIFFSPDGNEDMHDLPRFKQELENGADIVIASRMMKGAVNEEDAQFLKWRKWANNAFNVMANITFRRSGKFVTDTINGYRAITRAAADKLKLDAFDYTIEYQMTIRAFKNKLNVVEFPTTEGQRIAGHTGAPSFQTGLRFIKRFFIELFNR